MFSKNGINEEISCLRDSLSDLRILQEPEHPLLGVAIATGDLLF